MIQKLLSLIILYYLKKYNSYDLHVYDWGAQILIQDIQTCSWTGILNDKLFTWERSIKKYSGFYQIDTGSHLLTDFIVCFKKDIIDILKKHTIKYDDLEWSGYTYLQGGNSPINMYQDIKIDRYTIKNVPIGLMSIIDHEHIIKEREMLNGVFGLSHIKNGHPLKPYSLVDSLLKNVIRKTIFIDFFNKKMITGFDKTPDPYNFKGTLDSPGDIMIMCVWVTDNKGCDYKMFIDTGTLYSQFKYEGNIILNGIGDKQSFGSLKMNNAKILPSSLVGDMKPVILGYNDLNKGSIFIDYDNYIIFINQNKI